MNYVKDKVLKNCVRYKKMSKIPGPITIYMPNNCFDEPPEVLVIEIKQFHKQKKLSPTKRR